ncbi:MULTISPECIES: DUF4112 domain-containing protein [unclassified Okeania]|uniref:DUF4112 domain-containing protein n=1 Tax=unclassified Okeania TaxID=2634635 RepID=UPI0013B851F0|nr:MULTISPECIES: DUF4112 domain-containing protein [unclassified Okeania]NEP07643.1 DUF4112 domain-containing protein [Okeania sp. SIO4D6]NEP37868.1 DUF4112 domain-containing protein [Okeania sp. SIO2H7]NET11708.1 DUF4112 domain-containing protein [Okeania sp. SIO1H6]NEP71703.1 DUF4112 domain-containing protein [Okeania sp. SIO2G5]NEP91850.1 DUF4112 domain-containing protein [Okeania sp. SIO2F5]
MAKPSPTTSGDRPQAAKVRQLRKISDLLDNAVRVPGTSYGVGIDPLLGLIPGGGDFLGGLISVYIVFSAAMMGLPRETLMRMASNIVFDSLAGIVPVFGDLFDVAWKANSKNMDILEAHLESPKVSKSADRGFVFLLLGGLILFVIVIATLGFLVISLFVHILQFIVSG